MKILLANYRYFLSGGPERYMFNLIEKLENNNHTIIPFSINYERNRSTPYQQYFVSPIADLKQVYWEDHNKSIAANIKALSRLFYSLEVKRCVERVVEETTPDVAYVLHYLRKLSPSLIVGLKKKGIPVVVRLSDFMMICPQAHCLRNDMPCSLCLNKTIFNSVKYRCVKKNAIASFINLLSLAFHKHKGYFDLIDIFVTTNEFMKTMMIEAGWPENKLVTIPTFVQSDKFHPNEKFEKGNYICYAGRIEHIKGVHVLIESFKKLKLRFPSNLVLKIAGSGDKLYIQRLQRMVEKWKLQNYIQFVGELTDVTLSSFLSNAIFSVVPSLCYENLPNALIESYACGTPVIASRLGSLEKCVREGGTGGLFEAGDSDSLRDKMLSYLEDRHLLHNMAIQARQEALTTYSPEIHIRTLTRIFKGL